MARTKREQSPIGVYHVLLRSGENLFVSKDDRAEFELLCRKYFVGERKLYSFAMLSDRIHIIFSDGGDGASDIIKPLTTSYARYYNRTYERTGKLFADRYKSTAVKSMEELAECVIYVDSTYGVSDICDKDAFFKAACGKDEYEKRVSGNLEKVCLDAFDAFTQEEIVRTMCRMSGVSEKEFTKMDAKEKRSVIRKAAVCKWVSLRRMSEAAGLEGTVTNIRQTEEPTVKKSATKKNVSKKKPTSVKTEEKEEKSEEKKSNSGNLSVWLL